MESIVDLTKYPWGFPAAGTAAAVSLMTLVLLGALIAFARATKEVTPPESYMRPFLSVVIVLTFIMVAAMVLVRTIPENEQIGLLLGALISAFATIVAFWFTRKDST